MRRVNVAELSGAALDWAVAGATGYDVFIRAGNVYQSIPGTPDTPCFGFRPSVRWDQGGPLIESSKVELFPMRIDWAATTDSLRVYARAPTPLIAACRAIVAAKLGDTVEVPEELL